MIYEYMKLLQSLSGSIFGMHTCLLCSGSCNHDIRWARCCVPTTLTARTTLQVDPDSETF